MKHVKPVSQRPARATTDIGIGAILSIFAEILGILGEALAAKEAANA